MTVTRGAILIAGTSSGVGKTSLSLGIVRALANRGLRVRAFKVGPDFLDPSYLALASGRDCYNLDGWMTSRDYVQQLFARATANCDIAVIEGVMGLFDGASATGLEGSSAEIAIWLGVPVLLVTNAHGAARSLAATVKGFAHFEPALRIAGVIANHVGSDKHIAWLNDSLAAAAVAPLVGAMPRNALPALQSRHLGLVSADRDVLPNETLQQLADACEQHLDLDEIVSLAQTANHCGSRIADCGLSESVPLAEACGHCGAEDRSSATIASAPQALPPFAGGVTVSNPQSAIRNPQSVSGGTSAEKSKIRIGVARDEAFHFYYPDNLEILRQSGAEIVEFSPIHHAHLPANLDGIYLGGGYPELHAAALSANESMLHEVRTHAANGGAIYAECGGLMYLGRSLTTLDGTRIPMAGVIPVDTAMLGKLKSLGYVEVVASPGSIWGGRAGLSPTLRGHEFHYSQIVSDDTRAEGWQSAYSVRRRRADGASAEGFCKGAVLASYVHVHFGSCPQAVGQFLERCKETR